MVHYAQNLNPFQASLIHISDPFRLNLENQLVQAGYPTTMDRMNVFQLEQLLVSEPLQDVTREVHRALDKMRKEPPQGEVAITAGSRGISNLVAITKAAGDWLREHGAKPFLVPAMGSHNGATAAGQQKMVESLGLTPASTGLEIRSSMDCVKLGTVDSGDVWMDRHCYESAGVLVLNRIKLHTCFSGPVQSGLTKMMVVGMGKIRSAETFHSARPDRMPRILEEMGSLLVQSGKIFAGLAILEDGFDATAEVHALPGDQILTKEPTLLERHRHYFPALPCQDLNVLIVDEIGKTYSGTGMDTNVIGRRGVHGYEDLTQPKIKIIAALGLSDKAQGNALGVGLSDFITRRLRDSIDEKKTGKLIERFGNSRWMFIPNTLHLEKIFVSEDLAKELQGNPRCRVSSTPTLLSFSSGRLSLFL
jgi:hypothetical protein